jgi:branched-chain amino acid transport system substrate-binding protein
MGDTLLWWIAVGYDAPMLMAETIKAVGTAPEAITGYWNKLKAWPGIYGDISYTPEEHNGFPDDEVIFCEVNSLRDGAFNLAPGYGS